MAQFKNMASFFLVVAMYFASINAQESGGAPAPAPSMDKGAAFSMGISGAMICSSLLFSLLSFLKH
ncbi:hypothetical protein JCGZ_16747 [Jatropha curcas]|uniref:Transmembrane protein n=1 Tax=Jatropha curcas TaxID=180498 RepID=A0A067LFZ3_JATCU|nr:hypothetical protein JCGZ_16747 [Jatropha curcas]